MDGWKPPGIPYLEAAWDSVFTCVEQRSSGRILALKYGYFSFRRMWVPRGYGSQLWLLFLADVGPCMEPYLLALTSEAAVASWT